MARTARSISFDSHPEALQIIDALPNGERSAFVCKAIMAYAGKNGDVSLGDLYRKLGEIERAIRTRPVVANEDPPAVELEEDVRERLRALGR